MSKSIRKNRKLILKIVYYIYYAKQMKIQKN